MVCMPKCLKCDLDDVPEDHALRCPMRNHICPSYLVFPTNPTYPLYPNPIWTTQPWTTSPTYVTPNTFQYHTTCGSGCNHQ